MHKTFEVPERKICKTCHIDKPVSEFNLHHARIRGGSKYRGQCKICQHKARNKEKERDRGAIYRREHAEEIRAKKRAFLSVPENLEKNRAYAREYGRKRPEVQRKRLLGKYGLTTQEYDALLKRQNSGCAICGTVQNGKKMNFVIDHNHTTGKVRSLLCTQCNAGLGNYKESPDLLRKAAAYLESFTE